MCSCTIHAETINALKDQKISFNLQRTVCDGLDKPPLTDSVLVNVAMLHCVSIYLYIAHIHITCNVGIGSLGSGCRSNAMAALSKHAPLRGLSSYMSYTQRQGTCQRGRRLYRSSYRSLGHVVNQDLVEG